MTNYNTLKHNLKRDIVNYSKKISKKLKRTESKFTTQMIYGLLTAQSCQLSKISRALNEDILLKKTIDRLSRNLNNFTSAEILHESYLSTIKSHIDDESVLIIDGSDITKNHATKMECISKVRDGSSGEIKNGYHSLGIVALSKKNNLPIPVYSKIYSATEKNFKSENTEVLEGLDFLTKHFSNNNIRAFDRGYDNNKNYCYLLEKEQNFIIRTKKNRNVIYKDKEINILLLAEKFKGKYKLDFKKKNKNKTTCKISIIPIKLACDLSKNLNLVVCYGFGKEPMLLITNLKNDNKKICVTITKVYLLRWRIEEYYRFIKQQFKLEDLRVRSLNSIRNLNLILMIASGYISLMGENSKENSITLSVIKYSKRIYNVNKFVLYAISDGLFDLLNFSNSGISKFFIPVSKSKQITLSEYLLKLCS